MFVYVQNCVRVACARTELRMCWWYENKTCGDSCSECLYKTWHWKSIFRYPNVLYKQGTTNTNTIKEQKMSSKTISIFSTLISNTFFSSVHKLSSLFVDKTQSFYNIVYFQQIPFLEREAHKLNFEDESGCKKRHCLIACSCVLYNFGLIQNLIV